MRRRTKLGITLLSIGVLPYACMQVWVWRQQSVGSPLTFSVSLQPGDVCSPEFLLQVTTGYQVLIEFDRTLDVQRTECLLGLELWDREKRCRNIPEVDNIDWAVLSNGQPIGSGSALDEHGAIYSDTITKVLGRFDGKKGQHYRVTLHVRQDASELDQAKPRLEVRTFSSYWEGTSVIFQLTFYLALLLGGSGLLLVVPAWFRRSRRNV